MSQSKYIKGFTSKFDETVHNMYLDIQQKDFDAGVAYAEERIIKLLETGCDCFDTDNGKVQCWSHSLIALIKEEQE